jgi:hypothetical protein
MGLASFGGIAGAKLLARKKKKKIFVEPPKPLLEADELSFVVNFCELTNAVQLVWPFLKRPEVTPEQEDDYRKHNKHIGWPLEFLDFSSENVEKLSGLQFRKLEVEDPYQAPEGRQEDAIVPAPTSYPVVIQKILLEDQGIDGVIPVELGNLKYMEEINLCNNRLLNLPDTIGGCLSLSVMNMSYNRISSHLPASIGNLKKLEILRMYQNKMEGFLPQTLGDAALTEMALGRNKFLGAHGEEELRLTIRDECQVLAKKVVDAAIAAKAAVTVAVYSAAKVKDTLMKVNAFIAAVAASQAGAGAALAAQQADECAFQAEMHQQQCEEEAIDARMQDIRDQSLKHAGLVEPLTKLLADIELMAWLEKPPPERETKPRKSRAKCIMVKMNADAWLQEAHLGIAMAAQIAKEEAERKQKEDEEKAAERARKAEKKRIKKERADIAKKHAEDEQEAIRKAHLAQQARRRESKNARKNSFDDQ